MVEGSKLLGEALASGATVEAVFVDSVAASNDDRALAERARSQGADVLDLQAGVLARVADVVAAPPIMAVVAMVDVSMAVLDTLDAPLVVVGVGLQDPGNAGAVVRSAAAAGAGAAVFCSGSVDLYNPKTVRATAGALFHVPVVAGVDAEGVVEDLRGRGIQTLAAVPRSGREHTQVDLVRGTGLVFGGEANGLPPLLQSRLDGQISVPMSATAESLNVAMAATVLCFEAARQRRARPTSGPA